MRRLGITTAAVAAATALALAGCGSSDPATTSATVPEQPGPPAAPVSPAVVRPVSTWPGYHANSSETAAVAGTSLDPLRKRWTADLGGVVHGQAVVADGRVLAATENNRVVALSPRTGRVLWSRSLGRPLTDVASAAGCGDIDPLGITSTPVVDTATGVVYVVAEISTGGASVHHQLEGLSIATGRVVVSDDVDPPLPQGEHAVNLLQRASLTLADGRVYVAYGGNDGDCGQYHGWVVGVEARGAAHRVSFEVASDGQGGAIWEAGGAPAVDATGDLYVSTGNANPDPPQGGPDPKHYTESVVKLSPGLRPLASYKDRVAGGDEDLATGNPVLLPGGLVFAVGKTDIGYLLTQRTLRRVAAIPGICGSDPDGGPAYDASLHRLFVPCQGGGIQEVYVRSRRLGPRLQGANGAPILVGGNLWALTYPGGTLTEWNAATGRTVQSVSVGTEVANFASPSAALGLLLVPTDTGLTAYAGPAGVSTGAAG